ncbi:exodeoxyribonuclease VII large subunit [Catenovulum adriaticum]|uniref:Exodeoxyribonuclease 7 large subunit n=1 Tax=Catenovulum adriaticum TaxID=2984846 RepID=A0ABY7AR59_9ALTE|nr:exodeoxyribonuclease VII large subunit [Catenovulum sp. TS8]WAJ71161.1 exodeoxyribonuclease VII large subunit [Catenovulum sp. TS8]
MTISQQIYSVSALNQQIKNLLEQEFVSLLLEAEISNLTKASSGHWYFSLKDAQSQVKCAMFKGSNRFVQFAPENGKQVLVRANVSLYKPRGEYQLIVESMQPAGIGQLQQQFEALKLKLSAEGLFDSQTKQSLPKDIQKIGLITSAKGAAIHDILSIMARLAPNIEVIIYPCLVQGEQACAHICKMIEIANQNTSLDLLVVSRGGGSIEDLWAFNQEPIAYTIHYSRLPVISAVGHETDITIADLVADIRAATPSAAAEMVCQSSLRQKNQLPRLTTQLKMNAERHISRYQNQLNRLELRLNQQDPVKQMLNRQQWLDETLHQLNQYLQNNLKTKTNKLARLQQRLLENHPKYRLQSAHQKQIQMRQKLHQAMHDHYKRYYNQHLVLTEKLQAYSPLSTLSRGYSATFDEQGNSIQSSRDVTIGQTIKTRLADGKITSQIKDIEF